MRVYTYDAAGWNTYKTKATPTGKWKTLDINGMVKLYLELEIEMEIYEPLEYKRSFLFFKEKLPRKTKLVPHIGWYDEGSIIIEIEHINECTE